MASEVIGKSNMFGGSLNTLGTTSADLTLKTRGNVKILMGGKFVDLFRNGKVQAESALTIFEAETPEKDGITITPELDVFIKKSESVILLTLPKGSIIMWKGEEVPDGWQLCEDMQSESVKYIIKL